MQVVYKRGGARTRARTVCARDLWLFPCAQAAACGRVYVCVGVCVKPDITGCYRILPDVTGVAQSFRPAVFAFLSFSLGPEGDYRARRSPHGHSVVVFPERRFSQITPLHFLHCSLSHTVVVSKR